MKELDEEDLTVIERCLMLVMCENPDFNSKTYDLLQKALDKVQLLLVAASEAE